jgi:hypothetical protein
MSLLVAFDGTVFRLRSNFLRCSAAPFDDSTLVESSSVAILFHLQVSLICDRQFKRENRHCVGIVGF